MARNIHITQEPVTLSGYQAVLKPSKFGYSLKAVVGSDLVEKLEEERADCLKWAESKLKNPKRATLKPTPWEEVADGEFTIKFSWAEDKKPPVVDTEGTPITNEDTPVYEGSKVKLGFIQKPYILRDGVTYGTSLKLSGVQVVSVQTGAGVDTGDLDQDGVAELFGKTQGFKADEPNVTVTEEEVVPDDDF
jgi:hypothetical protein|tara:strand:- start:3748 stop:4320 length:573 start_codon:yes stop_codon:yes gene_type:complete